MSDAVDDETEFYGDRKIDSKPIPLLDAIKEKGRVWEDLADEYGVTNQDPPWKITLETTCDLLAGDSCVKDYDEVDQDTTLLPSLDRRWEEDALSDGRYKDVPFPERQLLSLAHSMINRGLLDEAELEKHMAAVEKRLNSG